MEVATLGWDLLLGCSSCSLGLVAAMALLSWSIDVAFCSLQVQTLLSLSSPLRLVIKPHTRSSSVYLMTRDNCSRWSGNRCGSSSWDLVGLDLSQGWLSPRREQYSCTSSRYNRKPSHLTMADQTRWAFFSPNCSNSGFPVSSLDTPWWDATLQTAACPYKMSPVPKQGSVPWRLGSRVTLSISAQQLSWRHTRSPCYSLFVSRWVK